MFYVFATYSCLVQALFLIIFFLVFLCEPWWENVNPMTMENHNKNIERRHNMAKTSKREEQGKEDKTWRIKAIRNANIWNIKHVEKTMHICIYVYYDKNWFSKINLSKSLFYRMSSSKLVVQNAYFQMRLFPVDVFFSRNEYSQISIEKRTKIRNTMENAMMLRKPVRASGQGGTLGAWPSRCTKPAGKSKRKTAMLLKNTGDRKTKQNTTNAKRARHSNRHWMCQSKQQKNLRSEIGMRQIFSLEMEVIVFG